MCSRMLSLNSEHRKWQRDARHQIFISVIYRDLIYREHLLPQGRGETIRISEILSADVLLPLPVQNLILEHILSDICYPKAHSLRSESTCFNSSISQQCQAWGHTPKSTGQKSKKRPDNSGI